MSHQQLNQLAASDLHLMQAPKVELAGTLNDANHARRRCQQRAISLTKIRIALIYGHHEIHHRLERWTLLPRLLRQSPYSRYEHELGGLQLVGMQIDGGEVVRLKTCKWNYRLRRH